MQPFNDSQNTPPRQNSTKPKQPFLQKNTGLRNRQAAAQHKRYVPKGGFIKEGLENQAVPEQPSKQTCPPKQARSTAPGQHSVQARRDAKHKHSYHSGEEGAELQSESRMVGVGDRRKPAASFAQREQAGGGLPSSRLNHDWDNDFFGEEDDLEEFRRLEDLALRDDDLEGSTGSLQDAAERLHLAATISPNDALHSEDEEGSSLEGADSAELERGSGQAGGKRSGGVGLVSQEHLGRLRSLATGADGAAASISSTPQRGSRASPHRDDAPEEHVSGATANQARFQGENKATTRFIQRLFHPRQAKDDAAEDRRHQQPASDQTTGGLEVAEGAVLLEKAAERASELRGELKAIQDTRARVLALKAQVEKSAARLEQEKAAFEQHKKEEAAAWEKRKQSEEARLKRERRALEQQSKAVLKLPTRKERSEVEALEAVIEKERRDGKAKEARHNLTVERLRRQIVELQGRNTELHKEVRWHEEQHLAVWESSEGGEPQAKQAGSIGTTPEGVQASGPRTQPSTGLNVPQGAQRSIAATDPLKPAVASQRINSLGPKPSVLRSTGKGLSKPSKPIANPRQVKLAEANGCAERQESGSDKPSMTSSGPSNQPAQEHAQELHTSYQVADFETIPSDETLARLALPEQANSDSAQLHSPALPRAAGRSDAQDEVAHWDALGGASGRGLVLGIPVAGPAPETTTVAAWSAALHGPSPAAAEPDTHRTGVSRAGHGGERQPTRSLLYSASPMSTAQQARLNGGHAHKSVTQDARLSGALSNTPGSHRYPGSSICNSPSRLDAVLQSGWTVPSTGVGGALYAQAWDLQQGGSRTDANGMQQQQASMASAGGLASTAAAVQEVRGVDGKVTQTYADGSQAVTFANGTVKREFPDGSSTISFTNGDFKRANPAGVVEYFYAEVETWHTTYPAGQEIFFFPSSQVEVHHPDGMKEITFPDGTIHRSTPQGREEEISITQLSEVARQQRRPVGHHRL